MISLEAVRASNRGLRAAIPGITALFVGGTSGIGQSTLRQLAIHSDKPSVHIVGRSEKKAKPFLAELQQINPHGKFNFIESDVSLMSNVDSACRQIMDREKNLNCLFMTPGGLSLSGRNETSEGIDTLFALRYYSRMRFIQNLLPLFQSTQLSRVISVYGGGLEYSINKDDLELKRKYSIYNCAMHTITMTSLSMEHLASSNPSVSFAHLYPGIVGTNIFTNSFRPPLSTIYNYLIWPTLWPFSLNLEECGERNLFHLTSARYPSKNGQDTGVPVPEGSPEVATSSTGEKGDSGAYLLKWNGDTQPAGKVMQQYREENMSESIWKHTTELFQRKTVISPTG